MRLHIFLEGIDDEKFFKNFLEGCLIKYSVFKYLKYKNFPKSKILLELKTTIEAKIDFIFLGDFDFRDKNKLNIKDKEKEIIDEWKINKDNISIAINEIESWYLAGFNDRFCKGKTHLNSIKIKTCTDTQLITKEFFDNATKKAHRNFINYLINKKVNFDYNEAKKRNKSFERFYNKYCG